MSGSARRRLALGLTFVGLAVVVPAAGATTPDPSAAPPVSGGLPVAAVDRPATSRSTAGRGPLLKPTNPKCVKRKAERKRLCGGRFRDRGRVAWWTAPPEFRIVDVSILGSMKIEALAEDDEMRFNGEGEVWISARKGFSGRFRLPKAGPGGVGITTATAHSVDWTSRSTGAWISSTGTEYGCGALVENGPLAPTRLAPLIATDPRKDELSINWNLAGPAFRCPKDLVDPPPFDERFSDASLIRYRASSLRGHRLVRLPIAARWSRTAETTRTTVEWNGHVLLQRVG